MTTQHRDRLCDQCTAVFVVNARATTKSDLGAVMKDGSYSDVRNLCLCIQMEGSFDITKCKVQAFFQSHSEMLRTRPSSGFFDGRGSRARLVNLLG